MSSRTDLLVHVRRISGVFERAFHEGPDGSLEGKFVAEHPAFVHHASAFYLAGCLAFLEGRESAYSWNEPGATHPDFDTFAAGYPAPTKQPVASRGITAANLDALAELRNAVVHNNGDLAKNRNKSSFAMVTTAAFPGVALNGTVASLSQGFLEYVRLATVSVRAYHGET